MRPTIVGLWIVVILASGVMVAVSGRSATTAASRARIETARAHEMITCAHEIAHLRAVAPRWTDESSPQPDLAQRLGAVIATAGLPASTLAMLTPDSRSAAITLTGLTLPRLGALLDLWREQGADWIVTNIELAPQSLGRRAADIPPGADLPLNILVRMESIHAGTEPTR